MYGPSRIPSLFMRAIVKSVLQPLWRTVTVAWPEDRPSRAEGFVMSRTTRYRTIPLLLAAAITFPLSAALPGQELSNAMAATVSQPVTVPAGHDYANTTFGDPWDYSNSSDLVLDNGPTLKLTRLSMSGGMVNFTTHQGYVSPIWGGYASEVPVEREGTKAGNGLSASTYTRMHLHIYVSTYTSTALSYYTCGALRAACNGVMTFGLRAGWNDIDLPIVRSRTIGKAWTGQMVGLRLAFGVPRGNAAVHLDQLRIYQPSSASAITWAAPGTFATTLWWTDSPGTITAVAGQHAGPVANAARSANSSARVTANVAGYAPGTRFWSVAANGRKTLVGATAVAPLPTIDSPSAAGCIDYATHYLGHPWTFTSRRSLTAPANLTALSFTRAGMLSATNAGPKRNDPNISLPIARAGINGRVYHRLTIVESYVGPFNLKNAPGGGTHARVLWQSKGHKVLAQTAPLVTFTGKRTLTVDMAMPASQLTDRSGSATQRYPFASASPVTRLRYDPNEDPGARRWHLYSVRLAADCQSPRSFAVTWHDTQYRTGSTVRLVARSASGHSYALGTTTEHSGLNSHAVSIGLLPRGKYQVIIYVTNAAHVTTAAISTGPLLKV